MPCAPWLAELCRAVYIRFGPMKDDWPAKRRETILVNWWGIDGFQWNTILMKVQKNDWLPAIGREWQTGAKKAYWWRTGKCHSEKALQKCLEWNCCLGRRHQRNDWWVSWWVGREGIRARPNNQRTFSKENFPSTQQIASTLWLSFTGKHPKWHNWQCHLPQWGLINMH